MMRKEARRDDHGRTDDGRSSGDSRRHEGTRGARGHSRPNRLGGSPYGRQEDRQYGQYGEVSRPRGGARSCLTNKVSGTLAGKGKPGLAYLRDGASGPGNWPAEARQPARMSRSHVVGRLMYLSTLRYRRQGCALTATDGVGVCVIGCLSGTRWHRSCLVSWTAAKPSPLIGVPCRSRKGSVASWATARRTPAANTRKSADASRSSGASSSGANWFLGCVAAWPLPGPGEAGRGARTPLNNSHALVRRFCRHSVRSSGMILPCRGSRGWTGNCWM